MKEESGENKKSISDDYQKFVFKEFEQFQERVSTTIIQDLSVGEYRIKKKGSMVVSKCLLCEKRHSDEKDFRNAVACPHVSEKSPKLMLLRFKQKLARQQLLSDFAERGSEEGFYQSFKRCYLSKDLNNDPNF